MSDFLFNREEILASLHALSEVLEQRGSGPQTVVVVGGSFVTLQGMRTEGTRDIDTANRLPDVLKDAAAEVAQRRGYRADWLNDRAVPFVPSEFSIDQCSVLMETGPLRVLTPPPETVFLMKLQASRSRDQEDLIALWRECSFESFEAVVDQYQTAYPLATQDPYLINYVRDIAERSKSRDLGPDR
jgi:Nucleotidyltransferase of unknown function (DUF6036)